MRRRRFRMGGRGVALTAAAVAIGVALLVLWFGYRHDLTVERLVAEGQLAQGRYLSTNYGSCGDDGCDSDTIHVAYQVDGVTYRTSMSASRSGREPIFKAKILPVPRLGPERPYQVVYLPSDPATSRLRADLSKAEIAVYGTAGMFLVCGLVFGAVGLFAMRPPRGLSVLGPIGGPAKGAETLAAMPLTGSQPKAAKRRYGKCRSCGARLLRSDHVQLDRIETVEERNWDRSGPLHRTRSDAHFRHLPCPRCGEAEPLRGLRNNPQMIAFVIVFVGIWAAGLYALFFL